LKVDIKCPKCGTKLGEVVNSELYIKGVSIRNSKIVCPNCRTPTYDLKVLTDGSIEMSDAENATLIGVKVSDKILEEIKKGATSVYDVVEKMWENQEGEVVCDCVAKDVTLRLAKEIDNLWEKVNYLLENAIIVEKDKREELKRTFSELEKVTLELKKSVKELKKESEEY